MRVSRELKQPLLFILFIACCMGLFIIFFPPVSFGTVLVFLLLTGLFIYGISRIVFRKRYAIVIALFVTSFLLLKVIGVFDTMNAILLISLFIGIITLIK